MSKLPFIEYVKSDVAEFEAAVISVSAALKTKPEYLMFLMWFETARTMNHAIVNKIGATGLIQFMPGTAIGLGTTTQKLAKMRNFEQMEYVKRHLLPFRGKYTDWLDLYCAIFWPAAVGKPDSYRITPDIVAKQNPLFDINKDKDIEKSEIRRSLYAQIPTKYKHLY